MSVDNEPREIGSYELAIRNGGEGMVGMDGSGNDWEFPEQLGNLAIEASTEEPV